MDKLNRTPGVDQLECISETLDLFSTSYVDTSLEHSYFVEIYPTTALAESSNSIDFSIPVSDDYLLLNESYVEIKMRLRQANNTAVPAQAADASYSVTNLISASLFSAVNVKLHGHLISDSYGTYGYVAFLQTLLSYNVATRKSLCRLMGYDDDSNQSALTAHAAAADSSFKRRAAWVTGDLSATFYAPIFHELFHQGRALLPHMQLSLEFIKAPAAFALMSNDAACTHKYEIQSMKLHIQRLKIVPSLKLELEKSLESKNARYPLLQTSVKPFYIEAGKLSCAFENVFNGRQIPSECIVGIVAQTAFRGAYNQSPYQFQHFNLNSLKISFDGQTWPSAGGFQPEYASTTEPFWGKEFLSLHNNSMKEQSTSGISYQKYKDEFCLYVFNFGKNPSHTTDHINPARSASARLDVTFATGTVNPALCLLLYTEVTQFLEVTAKRTIVKDYII